MMEEQKGIRTADRVELTPEHMLIHYAGAQDLIDEAATSETVLPNQVSASNNTRGCFTWESGDPISHKWARTESLIVGKEAPALEGLRDALGEAIPMMRDVSRRRRLRGEMVGDFDVSAYVQGRDNPWSRREKVSKPTRRITLGINVGAFGGVKPEQTLARGATLILLADWYASQGVGVEVICHWTSQVDFTGPVGVRGEALGDSRAKYDMPIVAAFTLKEFGVPLDLTRLALFCCNLTFARMCFLMARTRYCYPRGDLGRTILRDSPAPKVLNIDTDVPAHILTEAAAISFLREATGASAAAA